MSDDDVRFALLGRLIDHAPTFPPASLATAAALAEDDRAVRCPHAFALARLVWPASRLDELADSSRAVSAVLDAPLGEVRVEAVETADAEDLASLSGQAGEVYVEVVLDAGLERRLDALAAHGLRAKVRCGGATVPGISDLARFVSACRTRGLVFKATAGLHHAVRANGDHGLLNLLAAAVFEGDEHAALAESDAGAFRLDARTFAWRHRSAPASEVARVRAELLHSVGSCSFFEPIEELAALGALPA